MPAIEATPMATSTAGGAGCVPAVIVTATVVLALYLISRDNDRR
jgi:hypothetical protein